MTFLSPSKCKRLSRLLLKALTSLMIGTSMLLLKISLLSPLATNIQTTQCLHLWKKSKNPPGRPLSPPASSLIKSRPMHRATLVQRAAFSLTSVLNPRTMNSLMTSSGVLLLSAKARPNLRQSQSQNRALIKTSLRPVSMLRVTSARISLPRSLPLLPRNNKWKKSYPSLISIPRTSITRRQT